MSDTLRMILIVGIVIYFSIILHLLRRRLLLLKYSLLWLLTGIALTVIVLFPKTLYLITGLIGIAMPVNGLFLLLLIFVFVILLSLTVINSKQSNRIRTLAQSLALLEKRVRELEEREKQYEGSHYNIPRD